MFRFICIVIFLILYLILTIPVLIVEWVIGKFNPYVRDISSLRLVQWAFKVILKITGVRGICRSRMKKKQNVWCRLSVR